MGELFASAWRAFTERKSGRTAEEYYGRLVGKRNWKRVFASLFSAVFLQPAGEFPAELLFKRRPRRKDYPRTFTLMGGLGTLIERLAQQEHITLRTNARVQEIVREGRLFAIETSDGNRTYARSVVLALPPAPAAGLLAKLVPEASRTLASIASAEIVSTGVVVAKRDLPLPRMAGLVPLHDDFFSVVTRDVVEDDRFRGLAFHFRAGLSLDQRLDRIASVAGAARDRFVHVAENATSLPSLGREHAQIVAALDGSLAGHGVYVTGNFFGGLAVEDCVLRSRFECDRLLREVHRE
jgi:protoporphyrinogen oxidase